MNIDISSLSYAETVDAWRCDRMARACVMRAQQLATFAVIGRELGVSAERARHLEISGWRRMRLAAVACAGCRHPAPEFGWCGICGVKVVSPR